MKKFVLDTLLALVLSGAFYLFLTLLPGFDWHFVLLFLIVRHAFANPQRKENN